MISPPPCHPCPLPHPQTFESSTKSSIWSYHSKMVHHAHKTTTDNYDKFKTLRKPADLTFRRIVGKFD